MILRPIFANAILTCVCLVAIAFSSEAAENPPNILLIIADDMGLDASPCYPEGAEKPAMPTLEQLCRDGLVFDNFYATPVCSSTRASILTGRYGFRTGVGAAVGRNSPNGLPLSETTLFQFLNRFAPQPYAHAVIGKWHLATVDNGDADHPSMAGVGYYSGVISGTIDDYYLWPRTQDGETAMVDGYITSALTDEAIAWIGDQEDRPWFLWLAHVAPHLPIHLPPERLIEDRGLDATPEDMQARARDYYFASLEALDTEIGRLLNSLPQPVLDNTVILFLGDNGTPNRTVQSPYVRRRAKASLYEGGIHVPLIVAGKGVTRHDQREEALVNSTDLFATIANLAGIQPDATDRWPDDSVSFAPLLRSDPSAQRSFAYSELFGSRGRRGQQAEGVALRDDRWKYLETAGEGEQLFDLANDPYEQDDLLGSNQLTAETRDALDRLRNEIARLHGSQ
ncbi:MAG: sulfatase-like hydrolase/transferase [Alphaproteobacteria bacterium]|nr:sulfatase-like hydrolase/transferase [Alphaproteobacteria bacterium]